MSEEAGATEVTAADFPAGRWRGRFIWVADPDVGTDQWVLFRRRFDLDQGPDRAPARFFADARYVCWVNETEVARGPIRSQVRRRFYDPVDLAPHLVAGANVVAVLAHRYRLPAAWWMPPSPSILGRNPLEAGCLVAEVDLGDRWLVTDHTWKAVVGEAWKRAERDLPSASPDEVLDARELAANWREIDFDDGDWPAAITLAPVHPGHHGLDQPPLDPFGPIGPRPIAAPGGAAVAPVAVTAGAAPGAAPDRRPVDQVVADEATLPAGGGADLAPDGPLEPGGGVVIVTADFGRVTCGSLAIDLAAPAGAQLDLAVSDSLFDDGRLDTRNQRDGMRYLARGTADHLERFDPVGLRYLRLSVRSPDGPVRIGDISVQERLAPRPEGASFACSDERLTRIWEIGRATVDLCAHDAYLDCPTREHRAWTGDAVVHQSVDLATNPDWRLARWHPRLTASPRADGMIPMSVAGDIESIDAVAIPDWPLHWIASIHNLYRYTGDRDLVASLLPAVEGFLGWFDPFRGDDGLVHEVTGWVLIDWASVSLTGTSGALNALRIRGLRQFAELADWLGDPGRAARARAEADAAATGFAAFWDEGRGLYVDHIVEGVAQRPLSQHTNAAAVLAGLGGDRAGPIIEAICDPERLVQASWTHNPDEWPEGGHHFDTMDATMPEPWWDTERQIVAAQPFFRSVVHDAVAAAGQAERIAGLCLDWQRFVDDGNATWPETWQSGTRCHAWSSTPTRDLVVHTVGIAPAEPGFTVARVAPRLGILDWAEATAPSPAGPITVRADRERVRIDSPVPVRLDAGTGETRDLAAGSHDEPVRRAAPASG